MPDDITRRVMALPPTPLLRRQIARQISKMADATVYGLTYSRDESTRRMAMAEAHNRADRYAREQEGL